MATAPPTCVCARVCSRVMCVCVQVCGSARAWTVETKRADTEAGESSLNSDWEPVEFQSRLASLRHV
eukprot:7316730-Pyramimonas_sp.AAC.1